MQAPQQLIEAACTGDAAAISKLLQVCQPDLKRFARRTCSTTEDAEDAVQIALWQLYRRIGALRTAAAFATWLFRIVERECYRLFRARGPGASPQEMERPEAPAPVIPVDLRMDLTAAIHALPAPYRTVLILRDVDEWSAPEVAAELEISVAAVKSRLHRARSMVKERLARSGYWDADAGTDPAPQKGMPR